jgi:hypothetical protein
MRCASGDESPQSKRFAKFGHGLAVAKRLECDRFSCALPSPSEIIPHQSLEFAFLVKYFSFIIK